jgi:hypothetical protein|nr:calcium-binding protein [Xanthomonadaceae bacterium]
MSKHKPAAVALGTALAGFTLAGATFAMEPLAQGYLLSAADAAKAREGSCGEGKCGADRHDIDKDGRISPEEFAAAHPDHAEADRAEAFARIDTNGDGYIDAAEMDAHHAAKAAEGRCGTHHGQTGPKEAGEGKCGEGKCGEGKCGGMA